MKNLLSISKLLSAVMCISFALLSCKKDSNGVAVVPNAPTGAAFTFKVDGGSTITADSANAVLYNASGIGRLMDVYVYKSGSQILEFHFSPAAGNKTVGIGLLGGGNALLTYDSSPTNTWDSQSGAMNVTTCDTTGNKIIGDFNFVGKERPYSGTATKTITEGHMYMTKLTRQ